MGGRVVRHRLSLSSMVAAVLLLCPATGAVAVRTRAQTPDSGEHQESKFRPSSPCVEHEHTVSALAWKAQRVCGGAPAAEALLAVGLQPGEAAGDAERVLAGLGLRTALDLRIIGGGPEALDLMAALREAGLSLGDRSKIRLLLEDQAHLDRVVVRDRTHRDDEHDSGGSIVADATTRNTDSQALLRTKGDRKADRGQNDGDQSLHQRRLQTAAGDSVGMSMDTVAIVLTVLVGTAG